MQIRRLVLTDFRSCAHVDLNPAQGVNVLYGANAQGKSTLLEAIYMLATSRSPRAGKDTEMIRWGCDWANAAVETAREVRADVGVEISLSRTEKRVMRVNESRRARVLDLVGQLNAVMFSADDLEVVRGDPSVRRRFLNLEVSQISPQYCYGLLQYRRVVEQRNRLLKSIRETGRDTDTLDAWDDQLVSVGARLIERRVGFVSELSGHASRCHAEIAGAAEDLKIVYVPSFPVEGEVPVEEQFRARLGPLRREEIARGMTLLGPHRDDLTFLIRGADARVYASQGQQRSVALAVKLAEVELMRERVGEPPVVLLDDAGAELDEGRRERVFSLVNGDYQVLITCTTPDALPDKVLREACRYRVEAGAVQKD